ncbi:hypothetical protein PAPYR_4630 [Paratrimastix pyriformis]|uniref:F-box domain-containing protein n=1 Tax=Paratrimastix pyriformis TaxID=342808 RepID=A0ABQ8UPS7_9EUKA|nr:hypothetical protein PAPYR_4630 [Paratrimastix pyriformis]
MSADNLKDGEGFLAAPFQPWPCLTDPKGAVNDPAEPMVFFGSFPQEIYFNIFSNLSPQDLAAVAAVSVSFHALVKLFCTTVPLLTPYMGDLSTHGSLYLPFFRRVRHMHLTIWPTYLGLAFAMKHAPNCTTVSCSYSSSKHTVSSNFLEKWRSLSTDGRIVSLGEDDDADDDGEFHDPFAGGLNAEPPEPPPAPVPAEPKTKTTGDLLDCPLGGFFEEEALREIEIPTLATPAPQKPALARAVEPVPFPTFPSVRTLVFRRAMPFPDLMMVSALFPEVRILHLEHMETLNRRNLGVAKGLTWIPTSPENLFPKLEMVSSSLCLHPIPVHLDVLALRVGFPTRVRVQIAPSDSHSPISMGGPVPVPYKTEFPSPHQEVVAISGHGDQIDPEAAKLLLLLLQNGYPYAVATINGLSPLVGAFQGGHDALANFLLDADISRLPAPYAASIAPLVHGPLSSPSEPGGLSNDIKFCSFQMTTAYGLLLALALRNEATPDAYLMEVCERLRGHGANVTAGHGSSFHGIYAISPIMAFAQTPGLDHLLYPTLPTPASCVRLSYSDLQSLCTGNLSIDWLVHEHLPTILEWVRAYPRPSNALIPLPSGDRRPAVPMELTLAGIRAASARRWCSDLLRIGTSSLKSKPNVLAKWRDVLVRVLQETWEMLYSEELVYILSNQEFTTRVRLLETLAARLTPDQLRSFLQADSLEFLCDADNLEGFKKMVALGADVHCTQKRSGADVTLLWLVHDGPIIEYLVREARLDPNSVASDGTTPMLAQMQAYSQSGVRALAQWVLPMYTLTHNTHFIRDERWTDLASEGAFVSPLFLYSFLRAGTGYSSMPKYVDGIPESFVSLLPSLRTVLDPIRTNRYHPIHRLVQTLDPFIAACFAGAAEVYGSEESMKQTDLPRSARLPREICCVFAPVFSHHLHLPIILSPDPATEGLHLLADVAVKHWPGIGS